MEDVGDEGLLVVNLENCISDTGIDICVNFTVLVIARCLLKIKMKALCGDHVCLVCNLV
jgi:hypothetical protein